MAPEKNYFTCLNQMKGGRDFKDIDKNWMKKKKSVGTVDIIVSREKRVRRCGVSGRLTFIINFSIFLIALHKDAVPYPNSVRYFFALKIFC